jgi:cytochrome c-type biogenesis protein CcmE
MAVGIRKRRRIQLIAIGAAMLVAATALVGYGLRDGIQFFRSPSQVVADPPRDGERFRIGGLVEDGSLVRGDGHRIRFTVTDGGAATPVAFDGIPPDLFREGQGVIATGAMEADVFVATEILARHDESYMPREVADALKEQGLFRHGAGVSPEPER